MTEEQTCTRRKPKPKNAWNYPTKCERNRARFGRKAYFHRERFGRKWKKRLASGRVGRFSDPRRRKSIPIIYARPSDRAVCYGASSLRSIRKSDCPVCPLRATVTARRKIRSDAVRRACYWLLLSYALMYRHFSVLILKSNRCNLRTFGRIFRFDPPPLPPL